jgi:proteasome lid subunit RPN8/RPN11
MSSVRLTSPRREPDLAIQPAPFEESMYWRSEYDDGQISWPYVFLTQGAYRQVNNHALSNVLHEVGGMLLGQARRTSDNALYSIVEMALPAQHVSHGPTHLTLTSDTLVDLMNRKDDEYPEKQVVGWFHTHPGLSVFLSSYDVFLHSNFFPQQWQVALVIDPRADRAGFFRYHEGDRAHLHPQQYCGFFELTNGHSSIVTWQNFEPVKDLSK